jgi:putative ABC transport system permease protein
MRGTGILHLYRMRLRSGLLQEAFAVLGIAVGVGLLFASQVANTSLEGSVGGLTSGLIGDARLQLQARGPNGFPEALLREVQRLPGVRSAAPLLDEPASVSGQKGRESVELIGADPRFIRFSGSLLQHFKVRTLEHLHGIALPQPIVQRLGEKTLEVPNLEIGERSIPVLLGVTLRENEIGALVHSPVALAPLAFAQELSGMKGQITRIFVASLPGREAEVRAGLERIAAGSLNVEPADNDAKLFDKAAWTSDTSTAAFATISALVGFVFAFNAMLLTVPARRALIVDLRSDGYSPRSIIEILAFDALVLAVIASSLGLAIGDEISLRLFGGTPSYLSFGFPVGSQRIVDWQSFAVASTGGMLAAFGGVLIPLYDMFRRPRSTRMRSRRVRLDTGRALVLAGLLCLALTTGLLVFAPQDSVLAIVVLTASLLLLAPVLVALVLALVERATVGMRVRAPILAVAELRSSWARSIGIAATGALAVFGTVALQGTHRNVLQGVYRSGHDVASAAAVWVLAPGVSNLLATTAFEPNQQAELEQVPGVRAVGLYRGGFLDWGNRRVVIGAQPRSQPEMVYPHQLVEGNLAFADARVREGGWAVISQAIAQEHNLHVGEAFTLPSPVPINLRVAALSTNIGWPSGAVFINAEEYARAWQSNQASAYELFLLAGASASTVAREVRAALAGGRDTQTGLVVQSAAQREALSGATARQGLSRLSQIAALVSIAAVLAMAAAIANMVYQRRIRLRRLKLDGLSTLEVWRSLLLESALIVGAGCAIGAVFGIYGELLISHALATVTGFPVVFSAGTAVAVESFAVVSGVAVLITAVTGYLFAREGAGATQDRTSLRRPSSKESSTGRSGGQAR